MNLQLNNKRAFISGSTQGIGYAIATSLLEEGAPVVLNGRSQDKLDRVVKQLKQQFPEANISGITADFAEPLNVRGKRAERNKLRNYEHHHLLIFSRTLRWIRDGFWKICVRQLRKNVIGQ